MCIIVGIDARAQTDKYAQGYAAKDAVFEFILLQNFDHILKVSTDEVPNSRSISCSNSSMLECSSVTHATRIQFPAVTGLSRGALIEDGDDLGQVSSKYIHAWFHAFL